MQLQLTLILKGGPDSGHVGHAGRPGSVGGSLPGKGGGVGAGASHPIVTGQVSRMLDGQRDAWVTHDVMAKARKAKPGTKWAVLTSDEKQLVSTTITGMRRAARGLSSFSTDRKSAYVKYIKGLDSKTRDKLRGPLGKLINVYGADDLEAQARGFNDAVDYFRHLGAKGLRPGTDASGFMAYHAARKPKSAIVRRYAD